MNRGVNGEVHVNNAFLKRNGVRITEFLAFQQRSVDAPAVRKRTKRLLPLQPTVFFRLRLRLQNTAEFPNPHYLTYAGTNSGGWSIVLGWNWRRIALKSGVVIESNPGNIVGAITNCAGIGNESIGTIRIFDRFCRG